MDNTLKVEMGFVQRRLPWIVAGAMLLLYLITLSWWITPATSVALAKVAGWDWRPDVVMPLHVVLTWPIHWLPAGWQLPVLNVFEALCAALALALLARSVALLPHDRTKDQRQIERSDYSLLTIGAAWLPPVLAALVCGLQLTFWENAVASNGEMLDLLAFAYLIRCLLEFRLDHDERWLKKLALAYGLAVTNNFAMVGFFPAFLVAVVWIKWATFFNWRFVGRMVGWGGVGLLLYLVLPLLISLRQSADYSFAELLFGYWGAQKTALLSAPRHLMLFLVLTSLLPVLFIGIRWPASFGDVSPTGQALTRVMTHVIHIMFLAACLYVTFDFTFSPRRILFGRYAALPFYYLGALSVGYFAGYLLLVFGVKPDANTKSWQRPSLLMQITGKVLVLAVWLILLVVPAVLAWRNLPIVRAKHGPALSQHAALLADSLPAQNPVVVLGDDPRKLYALESELQKRSPQPQHILIESISLQNSSYHRYLLRRYGARLTSLLSTNLPLGDKIATTAAVDPYHVISILDAFNRSSGLYYIHPSHGYLFEYFHVKPVQGVYRMQPHGTNSISAPPLSAAELMAQGAYWKKLESSELAPLLKPRPAASSAKKADYFFQEELGVSGEVRMIYSAALNHLGFEARRSGDYNLAADLFDSALRMNGENPSALINREHTAYRLSGARTSFSPSTNAITRLLPYGRSMDFLLNFHGPPDEPSLSFLLARHFHEGTLYRQSAQWLERSLVYEPTNVTRRLFLISETLHMGMADHALALVAELRARPPVPLLLEDQLDLTRAEAWARFSKGDLPAAEKLLLEAQRQHPRESSPFTTLADIYLSTRNITNALSVYENQLKAQPESFSALVNLAALHISAGQHEKALPLLERALKLKSDDATALFNRGLCHLHIAQLVAGQVDARRVDAALTDFLQLATIAPKSPAAHWGVAECYRLKKNKTEALKYYERFLKSAPSNHPDRPLAEQRIKVLKSGGF